MPRLRPTLVDIGEGPVPVVVRDPRDGRTLPPEGRDVPLTPFWRRRLRDGDVEEVPEGDGPADAPAEVPAEA